MKKIQIDYSQLFESLPGLYLILSTDLTILTANNAYIEATMTKREEIVGRGLFDVFPDNPDDETADGVSNLSRSLNSVITNKKAHTMAVQKYDIPKPDGTFEVRYWSPVNIPILNSENEIEYIIHRVEDVTEYVYVKEEQAKGEMKTDRLRKKLKNMEMEVLKRSREIQDMNNDLEQKVNERTESLLKHEAILERQNKKLQSQNKELEQFTYITSHDLQEPLRSLISFSTLLENEFKEELGVRGSEYIKFISKSSERMKELVKVLMDYSRIGVEKELKQTDCHELLKEVENDMTLLIQETNTKVIKNKLPQLNGYPIELRQLFQNLISNAIKFRKKNLPPKITISAIERPEEWLFTVEDNGIGIDEKNADKLFIIFKRLHNRDDYEGTGIGLAHCKKIVELHGGTIWVEKNDDGSTFKFTIHKLEI